MNYTTFDIGIAAFLITKGYSVEIDSTGRSRVAFVFPPEARDTESEYWNEATIKVPDLLNNLRNLKSRIRGLKNEWYRPTN